MRIHFIKLPIELSAAQGDQPPIVDPNGLLYVSHDEEEAIRANNDLKVPLVFRANIYDCMDWILTSEWLDDDVTNFQSSKINTHFHFVQFDNSMGRLMKWILYFCDPARSGQRLHRPFSPGLAGSTDVFPFSFKWIISNHGAGFRSGENGTRFPKCGVNHGQATFPVIGSNQIGRRFPASHPCHSGLYFGL